MNNYSLEQEKEKRMKVENQSPENQNWEKPFNKEFCLGSCCIIQKKRQPLLAGFLNILVIGLGQIYNGELKKGIFYYLGSLLISLITAILILFLPFPLSFILFFSLGIFYFFFVFWVSWKSAKNKGASYYLKPCNRLYIYISFVFFSWYIINPIVSQFIKNNIVHAYRVIATSMVPTIFDGDHILVNELVYKFYPPRRGDVVVFRYPKNENQFFIKRIIGLPGETIYIWQKECIINGQILEEEYIIHASDKEVSPELDNFGPIKLLQGSYFMMGDNRDWSLDSRAFGPVKENKILGKAYLIYWSGSLNNQIFWKRIGKNIQ